MIIYTIIALLSFCVVLKNVESDWSEDQLFINYLTVTIMAACWPIVWLIIFVKVVREMCRKEK